MKAIPEINRWIFIRPRNCVVRRYVNAFVYILSCLRSMCILVIFLVSSSCLVDASDISHTIPDTVRIYASNDFPPYEFVDEDGTPSGYNIDIIRETMKFAGLNYKIIMTNWHSVMKAYDEGKADVILGISYSDERAKKFHFGISYASLHLAIGQKRNATQYKEIADMRNKKVILERGDLLEVMAHEAGLNHELMMTTDISKGARDVDNGAADAILCAEDALTFLIVKNHLSNLTVQELPIPPSEYGFAGRNMNLINRMDNALIKVKADGMQEKLYQKWLYPDNSRRVWTIVFVVLACMLIGFSIFFFFIYMLHRKVEKAKRIIGLQSRHMKLALHAGGVSVWRYDVGSKLFFNVESSYFDTAGCSFDIFLKRLHPDDVEAFSTAISCLVQGEEPHDVLIRVSQPDKGNYRFIHAEFATINGEDGHVVTVIGSFRDVTELAEIHSKLKEEIEKAQVADKLKSAFLANMSHEIRTPLNAIVGFSNLLPSIESENDKDKAIQIINTNNQLLLNLIDGILYLSKIEAGVIEIKNCEFDFAQTFNILSISLKERCASPDVEFLSVNPYRECRIVSDSNRIMQILTNFTTNAIKNTVRGHVKIGYECSREGITLRVEDTGIGIPEDKKNCIFNRFEKLNDFMQGTGLGLSICKAISDAWGGRLWLESEVGKGSTFFAFIPCKVISCNV